MSEELNQQGDQNQLDHLVMQFDPNTIEHLGIKMYSTLPPVIAEIVSNSYDAEATSVKIWLYDLEERKRIVIEDNGHGMTFQELNTEFLRIGRNRRKKHNSQESKNKKRLVIGKKGIGKLSFFGISEKIKVETVVNNLKNSFTLEWNELLKSGEDIDKTGLYKPYQPKVEDKDKEVNEGNGTRITLFDIKRKTSFDPNHIAYSLSKTFQVFDEDDFEVVIYHNSEENKVEVTNDLRYQYIEVEHEWDFPLSGENKPKDANYYMADIITGKVILAKDTVGSDMEGIALFSRNKLVNEHSFYGVKATSHGYSYLTGILNVDFIDMFDEDVISTNRRSLNWETEETRELKQYLELTIRSIYNQSKKLREAHKIVEIEEATGEAIESWMTKLPSHERTLAQNLVGSIVSTEGISKEKAGELVKFVKDSFQFEAFKEIASEYENVGQLTLERILELFREWELIEAREMYKLSIGRIQTIKTFERLIDENAKEVQEIHPFFEKFPWVLDPRINMFRHELQYVKILKENFREDDEEVNGLNRRIDFLCTSVSQHRFIIELKRPHHKIKKKDIDQAKDYRSFIEEKSDTDPTRPQKVIAYVVGGEINNDDRLTRQEIEDQQRVDKVYVRTYNQLLTDARNYHKEFIDRYNELTGSV